MEWSDSLATTPTCLTFCVLSFVQLEAPNSGLEVLTSGLPGTAT